MQNTIFDSEPAYLSTLTSLAGGNLLNTTITTLANTCIGLIASAAYAIVKHIHVTNQLTTAAVTISLFKGASGAQVPGTQFAWTSVSIPAGLYLDWYGQAKFINTDYLTGVAWGSPQSVIINIDGEIGIGS